MLFDEIVAIQEKVRAPNHPWSVDDPEDFLKLVQATGDEHEAQAGEASIRDIKETEGFG